MTSDRPLKRGTRRGTSPYDKTAPDDHGATRRPLNPPPPVPATKPRREGPVSFGRAFAWLLTAAFVALVAWYAAVVIQADKAEPTPPPNQPTSEAS